MSLTFTQRGPADAVIRDDRGVIAEIRNLKLESARFRSGGRVTIGETVPLPLYWMQYANHQDPERSACADAKVALAGAAPAVIVLDCLGATASGACLSAHRLTIREASTPGRYIYRVSAKLRVEGENGWLVTPNPDHGEVEFANIWPEGTFSPERSVPKLYEACYHVFGAAVEKIPHHHLESSDKHNIMLGSGDKFLWLQEDDNLCLTMISQAEVRAGVCAYMWDAHFGFKVCEDGREVRLPPGAHFEAEYELTSLSASETDEIVRASKDRPAPERATTPIVANGVNRFWETLDHAKDDWRFVWPWETEGEGDASLAVDRESGFDDRSSLRITSSRDGRAAWKATTLGPAFGGEKFPDSARYRFTAMVKTRNLKGRSTIAVRFHREGVEGIYRTDTYEVLTSQRFVQGDQDWTMLEIVTPPISPAPDRFHLLLVQEGRGTTWFDNACLEVLP